MHKQLMRGALAAAGLGVAVTTLAVAPAQAATAIQVRPADLVLVPGTVSGTTGAAKADFLAEGIHIKTTNNTTDAARGYWKVGVPLSQVHTVEYEWFGTRATTPPSNAGEPGLYYNIDIDGDGKADGQLIGELAYGGKDVWLNRDAEDFTGVTPTVPAGFFAGRSPCSGANAPQNGNVDGCTSPNGSGAAAHGTIDDWVRSLSAAGKTANLVSAGYVATGFVYDGVLRSATFGPNQYLFTNSAKSKVTATAAAKHATVKKGNKVVIKGKATPVGPGAKVTLEVKKKDGTWKTVQTKDLAASGDFKLQAKAGKTGKAKYRVTVSETNSTAAATSNTVKVQIVKK